MTLSLKALDDDLQSQLLHDVLAKHPLLQVAYKRARPASPPAPALG
jgi:hypothetical protein